jgi:monothiol glutaredoxin
MNLDDTTRSQIDGLIQDNRVMLFMKGQRGAPQCGFSAQVTQVLDSLLSDYSTFDVLSDGGVREGIKAYSNWPTIPQLYVGGEFLGGCDIILELFASGDLHEKLGVERPEAVQPPDITVTDKAAEELGRIAAERPGQTLHLQVDASFEHGLFFGPDAPGELRVKVGGIEIAMDPLTAGRAEGLTIDLVETDQGAGFHIQNPNAPTAVEQLAVTDLKAMLDRGEEFIFLDVRTPDERETARIEGAQLLDPETAQTVEKMDRDTVLVLHCHHGGRSQQAAEHFAALGFTRVFNVVGGIDAWSQQIDSAVPRY